MYRFVTENAKLVVDSIPLDHVEDYVWLLNNFANVGTPEYQRNFRKFWGMNVARLSDKFFTEYFRLLAEIDVGNTPLSVILMFLYKASESQMGTRSRSLQFSFTTKLLHMRDTPVSIYDSKIVNFYFFKPPSSDSALPDRIHGLVEFHNFLTNEYARSEQKLLDAPIGAFRKKFTQSNLTDERVIDSLIWSTSNLLRSGILLGDSARYL